MDSSNMVATKNERINYSNPSLPLVEPHLVVNPANNDHMVAAAIVFDSAASSENRTHIVVFATKDNGKTWKQSDLSMTVGFDPWLAIKSDSIVALVAMAGYGFTHRTGLVYYLSEDGGFTWSADSVKFGYSHDHPTMITDPGKNDRLYVLSSLSKRDTTNKMHTYAWLTYSDNWKTFSTPTLYYVGPINSNTLTVAVRHDGTVILPFVEYDVKNDQPGRPVFKLVYSKDGIALSTSSFITNTAGLAKGFAVFATDLTGKHKGRTYFVKNTGPTPSRSNGLYVQYADKIDGEWSEDIRVDHNHATEKFIRTAAIAVNKDGLVGIVWVDRRNDQELKRNDIYFTVSADGGKTFEPEIRVTDENSDPSTTRNGKAGQRFISGGDYIGCAAKPDGSFQVLWADSRSSVFQLYTSNIKVSK